MDIQYFFNVLKRRKWLIILPMILTAIATYYFVDQKEEMYDAKALVATGIVNVTGLNVKENSPFLQKMQVEISFANLLKFVTTKGTVRFLGYHLLLHDLAAKNTGVGTAFREPDLSGIEFTGEEMDKLINQMRNAVDTILDSTLDTDDDILYRKLAKAYGYDYETLMKENFFVEREGETDLLQLKFVDKRPEMCSFAVNNFFKTLRSYHVKEQGKGDLETYGNYQDLAASRRAELSAKQNSLDQYKNSRGLLDISSVSTATVRQIQNLEEDRLEAMRKKNANAKTITRLNDYLNDNDRYKLDTKSNSILNSKAIVNIKNDLAKLRDQLIDAENDKQRRNIKSKIELTEKNLNYQIGRLAKAKSKEEPGTVENESGILAQRVEAESELILAEESLKVIEYELTKLRARRDNLVRDDAQTKKLEKEIEIMEKTFRKTLDLESEMQFKTISAAHELKPLSWADVPEEPIPDNKYLLSGFAGLVTGSLATLLLFLLAFFDLSLNSPNQFQKFTNLNLLGTLNRVKDNNLDLKQLFSSYTNNVNLETFKESVRKIRYVIEESGNTTFLFTSTKDGEGKTFLILTLAYALTLKDKKIMLIDTNFKNNTLTRMSNETIQQDNLLYTRLLGENNLGEQFEAKKINTMFNLENVDIIGNRGTSNSPSEFFAGRDFQNFISELSDNYDYIFMEGAALNKYSDTRELVGFADKVISVFSSESEIKETDKDSINYLLSLKDKFMGSILNKLDIKNLN